jgi:hypothetical protein
VDEMGHGPKNARAGYGQPTVEELLEAAERLTDFSSSHSVKR